MLALVTLSGQAQTKKKATTAVEQISITAEATLNPQQKVAAHMKADGYEGWLSLEYERRWHPDDIPDASIGMKQSADYLKTITL